VDTAIAFGLGMIVAAGVLVPRLLRLRDKQRETDQRIKSVERGHRFLAGFLTGYPYDARLLYAGGKERQIPELVIGVLRRRINPTRSVILVRRGASNGAESSEARLAVVAADPEDALVPVGTEIPAAAGELGLVAEAQLTMSRADLDSKGVAQRVKPGGGLPKLRPDLVAPIVFERDTLGLIALNGRSLDTPEVKAAVGLIAQTAAQAIHYAAHSSIDKTRATIDDLTGIQNKGAITRTLSAAVYQAACAAYDGLAAGGSRVEDPARLSVFLFDIDQFKHYNDAHGHPAGDKLLKGLAELVLSTIRKGDTFGRFGGEEFLVIFPGTNQGQGMIAAEKVRNRIAAHPFPFGEQQPLGCVSVSGGLAWFPECGASAESLIQAADVALYAAKRAGRNRVFPAAAQDGPPGTAAAGRSGQDSGSSLGRG